MIQIYHNPRCGKSRNALAFLEQSKQNYEIIQYLNNPPTEAQLVALLKMLSLKPIELVRQKEKIWIENFKNKTLTDTEVIKALVTYPILIERPIVIKNGKAIIARDLDKLPCFI
ncbi:arsenate reductase (glutaredoxin) [Flavobacterium crassostreae]|uniref:Arsenate reductase n=1 Tax=Flavobacterium crassostreae TaxID=1763534 RepID=A0A1B9E9N2_9FLAO|nr:arsenate reductase (glutaredoxin) [Flavobacterium crassostreae]OCB78664.1 arsenate reductase [Flavobacterium crassostreae]